MPVVELDHLPAQDEYYNAPEWQVAFVAGIGYGKTRVACDDMLRMAALYPRCGKGDEVPGLAICSNTYPQLVDGTMGSFFDACRRWGLTWIDKIRSEHKIYIPKFDCWIGVHSADDPEKFKSLELCFVWIDEAQKWDKLGYDKVLGRLRGTDQQRELYPDMQVPRIRITANPPHTMDHWLVDLTTKIDPATGKPPCRLINATTFDNPFIPQTYIDGLVGSYDPELVEIELGGKFGELGKGRILRQFSRAKHVYTEDAIAALGLPPLRFSPVDQWGNLIPLNWSHDFNVDPLCSCLFQWRRVDHPMFQSTVMYVIDEMHIRNSIIRLAVDELLERPEALEIARRSGLVLFGDASGNASNRQTGESDWNALIAALEEANLWGEIGQKDVDASNPARIDRYAAANRMLVDGHGKIGVVIHERCVNTIRDCERMFYKPGTRLVETVRFKDGVPLKVLTHNGDAFMYPIAQKFPVELHAA